MNPGAELVRVGDNVTSGSVESSRPKINPSVIRSLGTSALHPPRFRATLFHPEARPRDPDKNWNRNNALAFFLRGERTGDVEGRFTGWSSSLSTDPNVNERKGILRFTLFRSRFEREKSTLECGRRGGREGGVVEDEDEDIFDARERAGSNARTRRERLRRALSRLARTHGRIITPLRVVRANEMARGDGARLRPCSTLPNTPREQTRGIS